MTLRNYHYYSAASIVLTIVNAVNTSSATSSTDLITTFARRTLNISFIASLSSSKNSDVSSDSNKQTDDAAT